MAKLPITTFLLSLALATTLLTTTTSHARPDPVQNPIRLFSGHPDIQTLGKHLTSSSSLDPLKDITNCQSLVWGSETNNIRDWDVVPEWCVDHVKDYMVNGQYITDLRTLFFFIVSYLNEYKEANPPSGKEVVVFDLSDTLLSNLPYYSLPEVNYGSRPFNWTKYIEWTKTADIPAVQYMQLVYWGVLEAKYKPVIISGLDENFKTVIETNLEKLGYAEWFKLAYKPQSVKAKVFQAQVRANLVDEGYKIVANIGDQWRSLTGPHAGERVFKVPNPMYKLE